MTINMPGGPNVLPTPGPINTIPATQPKKPEPKEPEKAPDEDKNKEVNPVDVSKINPAEGVIFNAPVPNTIRNVRQMYPSWSNRNYHGGSKYMPRHGLNGPGFIVRDVSMNQQLKDAQNGWAKAQELWGFQFHFNPSTFSESFSPPDGLDWAGFLQDIAMNPMFIQGHQGNSQIQFQILLARFEDMRILLREDWKSFYDTAVMGQDDRQEILEYGTQYDIERFFRVVNLDPVMTWRGKTSDWGMMMAIPVMVFLGDSVGSRKFRAQIQSFNIQHQLYTQGMIPVYSQITINMNRIPDPYTGTIGDEEGSETPDNPTGAPEPHPPGDPRNPVTVEPGTPSGGPSAIRDRNIRTASEIFVKSYPQQTWKWTESDFNALMNLWDKESRWNQTAHNKKSSTYRPNVPGSGAYGIPQAMPGTKMQDEGADWLTNPATQIHWGLKYIKRTYETPSKAWDHSKRKGWY